MTYQEWIDRSIFEAAHGLAADTDLQAVAEAFAPEAAQQLSWKVARSRERRSLLRRTKSITMTNGAGTLSADVMSDFFCEAEFYDAADLTKQYVFVPERTDFRRARRGLDAAWGEFTVDENVIRQTEPQASFTPGAGFSGTMTLVAPCVIEIPATASSTVVVHALLEDELVMELAALLKGGMAA